MESKAIGLMRKLESIKAHADAVIKSFERANDLLLQAKSKLPMNYSVIESEVAKQRSTKIVEARMILEAYRDSLPDIFEIAKKVMPSLSVPVTEDGAKGLLRRISIECDGVVGFLSAYIVPLSPQDVDKLHKLRAELSDVTVELDPEYERNLIEAINEQEKGHCLASALITSRVINYVLDQIKGGDIEAKVKFLQDQSIVQREDEKAFIMKACKKARNVFSHDIKFFADPSDSLGLLGDCVKLLRLLAQLKRIPT